MRIQQRKRQHSKMRLPGSKRGMFLPDVRIRTIFSLALVAGSWFSRHHWISDQSLWRSPAVEENNYRMMMPALCGEWSRKTLCVIEWRQTCCFTLKNVVSSFAFVKMVFTHFEVLQGRCFRINVVFTTGTVYLAWRFHDAYNFLCHTPTWALGVNVFS